MQVSVKKVNGGKLFARKYPAAAKQITSYREMEAGLMLDLVSFLSCIFPTVLRLMRGVKITRQPGVQSSRSLPSTDQCDQHQSEFGSDAAAGEGFPTFDVPHVSRLASRWWVLFWRWSCFLSR